MRIKTKKESYKLVHKGAFGNKFKHWDTYDDLMNSGFTGNVSVRYKSDGEDFVLMISLLKK